MSRMTFVYHMKICSQEAPQGKFYVASEGRSSDKCSTLNSLSPLTSCQPKGLGVCVTP
jgi:hypothetical protein